MKFKHLMLLSVWIFGALRCVQAEKAVQRVSVCSLQENAEKFLNATIEVRALIFGGIEYPRIEEGKCSFRFAGGDDYQTFGDRFRVKHNAQWDLMKKLLGTTNCASNLRVVRAKIRGTVVRVPAAGTIPENEMPMELVIQSVSEVSIVPIRCTPARRMISCGEPVRHPKSNQC
jgi:hypothetical protein